MTSKFESLRAFVLKEMRMSHIYQPAMLIKLLSNGGRATTEDIAKFLASFDRSQIEYYEHITKNMVGRVLSQNRKITKRTPEGFSLIGYEELDAKELEILIASCEEKIAEFLGKRKDPWGHRRKSSGYIKGTVKYRVLSRAKFRCELCGVTAEDRALEVDHIVPRNHGGSDSEENLQALCYTCNAMKRDTDDTDFRRVKETYGDREAGCPFCEIPPERVIAENELAVAILDAYPVSEFHTLIIPKRHVADYFSLYQPERNAVQALMESRRIEVLSEDPSVEGFNVGINAGEAAGQTVMHCHVHLIPRRAGDTPDPAGGIRGVIPGKQKY